MVVLRLCRFWRNRSFHQVKKATYIPSPRDNPLTDQGGGKRMGLSGSYIDQKGGPQVPEVFYYAQKAVRYPMTPLFDQRRLPLVQKSFSTPFLRNFHCTRPSPVSRTMPLLKVNSFHIEFGDAKELNEKILDSISQNSSDLSLVNLIYEFNRDVRPSLVASCLIVPNGLRHKATEFLHCQSHKFMKRKPLYLSSLDVMLCKKEMGVKKWLCFMEHLITSRIYVVENWQSTYGNIEKLCYDFGIKGCDGVDILKGECDASFDEVLKKAKLSFVIWKGDEIIWAQVTRDVDCPSSVAAEAYAVLTLLWKAEDLHLLNLAICIDNWTIFGVLSGSLTIKPNDDNYDLYLLLRGMRKQFDIFIPMWKPRLLMFLPDDLASNPNVDSSIFVETILNKWSYHFSGMPLFKISQSKKAREIISKFEVRPYEEELESKFFLVVEDGEVDAMIKVTETLRPSCIYAAIERLEEKSPDFQRKINNIFTDNLNTDKNGDCTLAYAEFETDTGDKGRRVLLFVFDLTFPEASYAHLDAFTVFLIAPKDIMIMKKKGIKELNALSYIYYHGVCEVTAQDLVGEEEEDLVGEDEEAVDVVGLSHSHPKYWWWPDLAWPGRQDILNLRRSRRG